MALCWVDSEIFRGFTMTFPLLVVMAALLYESFDTWQLLCMKALIHDKEWHLLHIKDATGKMILDRKSIQTEADNGQPGKFFFHLESCSLSAWLFDREPRNDRGLNRGCGTQTKEVSPLMVANFDQIWSK